MNILIVGCRGVGSALARELDLAGHAVSVLDESPENLRRLDDFTDYDFGGMRYTGIPIDTDVLKSAGIENVEAVACVTADDSTNLMVCQMATELFGVKRAVCRVADPVTKDVYSERFGLRVVCPTNLTTDAVASVLLHEEGVDSITMGSSTAAFTTRGIEPGEIGKPLDTVAPGENRMVFGIWRANGTMELNTSPPPVLRNGDRVIFAEISD